MLIMEGNEILQLQGGLEAVLIVHFDPQVWIRLHAEIGMAELETGWRIHSQSGPEKCDNKNNTVLLQTTKIKEFFDGVSCCH